MVLQNGEKHNGESYKTANPTKNGEYHLEYKDMVLQKGEKNLTKWRILRKNVEYHCEYKE